MIDPALAQALAPDRWPAFVLITARLTGLMMTAPLWSMTALPRAARAAITVLLALVLLPGTPPVPEAAHVLDLPLPIALELIVGLAIGLTAAVLVQGVALAGEVISLQMGLSLGPALAPMPDVQVSGVGQLKTFLALLIYVSVGGHLALLDGLAQSLRTLPPGQPMDLESGGQGAAMLLGSMFSCAVRAAAPVMVTLLIANVALAILSRAVPQLNTMMVSLPVTAGIGLIMLGASLPLVATAIGGWMDGLPSGVAEMVGLFRLER